MLEEFLGRIDRRRRRIFLLGQPGLDAQLLDQVDDLANLLVAKEDRQGHVVLGHFAREAFDHRDRVLGAGDDQIEIAFLHLRHGRHGDEFAADSADADGAGELQEGDVRDVQGGRCADHAQDIGIVLAVERHARRS